MPHTFKDGIGCTKCWQKGDRERKKMQEDEITKKVDLSMNILLQFFDQSKISV